MEKIKTIEELKTCPFCGGEAEMITNISHIYSANLEGI